MEERKFSEDEVDIHSDAHGNPANQADSTEDNNVDVQEPPTDLGIGTARKPPDKTLKEKFQTFLHDPKEGSYLGRTPKSWVLIFIFFVCFYAVVAGIWVGCWYIFLQIVSSPREGSGPTYRGSEALIGNNPGVGVSPRVADKLLKQRSNIRPQYVLKNGLDKLQDDKKHDNKRMVKDIFELLNGYKINPKGSNYTSFDPTKMLGDCAKAANNYGYTGQIEPCFYLTLNKIWEWKPKPMTREDFAKNRDWPEDVKFRWEKSRNNVFFNCDEIVSKKPKNGTDDKPRKKIVFKYYPDSQSQFDSTIGKGGISLKYFPYKGYKGDHYQQPIVAVKLKLPNSKIKKARDYVIECKAYFHGVTHSSKLGKLQGLIQFEVKQTP